MEDVSSRRSAKRKRSFTSEIMFECISYNETEADTFERSSLLKAFQEQNITRMKSILQNGVNAITKNIFLHYAVGVESLETIRLLIDFGADVNYQYRRKTVLCKAVVQKNTEIVALLLRNGANPESDPNIRLSALYFAIIDLNVDICKLLLEHGADITHSDIMLLYYVIENKNRPLVELFMKYGVGINSFLNNQIPSPLHHAVGTSTTEIVHILLENGVDVNAVNELNQTALFLLSNTEEGILDLLLQYDANVNVKDVFGRTPLHYAVLVGKIENIRRLIEFGADINAVDDDGDSLLHYAFDIEQKAIGLLLLEHGADINCLNNFGKSPLCRSIQNESVTNNILLSHTILLKVLNRYVHPINLKCLHDQMNNVHVTKKILMCEMELQRMKNEKFGNEYYISLYDIISKPLNQVAHYVRNKEIRLKLETTNYETRFPIYSYFINSCIKKSIKMAEHFVKSYDILNTILNSVCLLPTPCVCNIIEYFNDNDVQKLINSREQILNF